MFSTFWTQVEAGKNRRQYAFVCYCRRKMNELETFCRGFAVTGSRFWIGTQEQIELYVRRGTILNSRCAFHCQINCNFCDRIKNLLCLLIKYTFIYTPLVLLLHSRTKVFMTKCEKKVKPSLKFSTALYLAANSDFATFRYLYYLTTFWINCTWFVYNIIGFLFTELTKNAECS